MTDRACLSRNEAALTDDEIMRAACTAADSLDATRVSEMTGAGWKATTIFKGDAGLLRFGRLIEATVRAKRSEKTGITPMERFGCVVLDESRESLGDLDGGFLQDAAEACGLLESVTANEPCGEHCRCAEYGEFPQECLRLKAEFEPKMAEARANPTEREGKANG